MQDTQDNPYSAILGTLRRDVDEHKVSPWRLGRVVSVTPLVIQVAGISLGRGDLLVNPQLLPHARTMQASNVTGAFSAGNDCESCSMSSLSISSGSFGASALLGEVLAPGDQVVLLQSGDGQQYVVLCKVVNV